MKNNYKFIRGKYVLPMNRDREFIRDGLVVVENDRICDIGRYDALIDRYRDMDGEWMEYEDGLIMPGLVSNHTHLYQAMMKGIGSDLCLDDWVINVIYPMALAMKKEDFYDIVRFNILEMISTGTTCFADSMYHHHNLDNIDGVAEAVRDMHMRGMIVRAVQSVNFDERIPDACAEREIEITRAESIRCIKQYDHTENGRIRVGLEALSPFDCDERTIRELYGICEEYDVRFQMHVAEAITEQVRIRSSHNMGVIEYLDKLGVVSDRTLLIHNIWVTPSEIQLIARRRANVAHNPVSNMILADGIAPIPEYLANGITVGLGVDGAASNNNQDMFETMKACVLLHRVNRLDASIMKAYDALEMATISSARSIGWEKEIGSLEVGKKADLIVVKTNSCHMGPQLDVVTNLVFSGNGRDVDTVMIDGDIVMKNREFTMFHAEEIVRRGNECALKIAEKADVFNRINNLGKN